MAGEIPLPGGGSHPKKQVYLYGGAIAAVVALAIYKKKKDAAAAASATPTDPTQIDPATGFSYGSSQDAAALAASSAYQNPVDYGGGGGAPNVTPVQSTAFTTNAQWKQAADNYLTGIGLDAGAVSSALGKYLAGEAMSPQEKNYAEQAIASEGQPPTQGPNGYPPSIRTLPSTGPVSLKPLPEPKLTANHAISPGYATVSWDAVPGARVYVIQRLGHGYISKGSTNRTMNVPRHSTYSIVAHNPGKAYDSPPLLVTVS